jgi:hypothetical protein
MAEEKKSKSPIYRVKVGNLSGAVFSNTYKGKDGKNFEMESIQIQKSFTRDEGKTWENQNISIRKADIIKLQIVLNKIAEQQFLKEKEAVEEA